jgi:DNA-binding transcriptional MocR family regulator
VGPGELVLSEALTYPGFVAAAKLLGLRLGPVAIDEAGIIPESLEAICRVERPRLLYCMPTLQNPTTAMLCEERRWQIAQIARTHDLVIVQDDIQGGSIDDPASSIAEMAPERVLTIAGVSKNLAPGLRVAYLAGALDRIARLSELIWSSVWMAPPIGAELAAQWIKDGTARRLLTARRAEMDVRHELARSALAGIRWRSVPGAYHLWLELDHGWTGQSFASALRSQGIAVTASDAFLVGGEAAPAAVRISLSATRSLEPLRLGLEAVARLAGGPPTPASVRL